MPNATYSTARKAEASQWGKEFKNWCGIKLNQHKFILLNLNQARNQESLVLVHVGPKYIYIYKESEWCAGKELQQKYTGGLQWGMELVTGPQLPALPSWQLLPPQTTASGSACRSPSFPPSRRRETESLLNKHQEHTKHETEKSMNMKQRGNPKQWLWSQEGGPGSIPATDTTK